MAIGLHQEKYLTSELQHPKRYTTLNRISILLLPEGQTNRIMETVR